MAGICLSIYDTDPRFQGKSNIFPQIQDNILMYTNAIYTTFESVILTGVDITVSLTVASKREVYIAADALILICYNLVTTHSQTIYTNQT